MDSFFRGRRSSFTPPFSQCTQEPLIVVEESENCDKEEQPVSNHSSPRYSLDIDSPVNPYLLSPWRDPRETRKHSLPTPPCTSGITASQVRRLSERGGEGSGPSPREQAFLATLSQAPAPQPGGRRHSVVTISKVPPTLFGRSRRESIAAVPTFGLARSGASSRRESNSNVPIPPTTDHRGSVHNLQLDIMDDIVQARKAKMKLWNTSNEKVCEVIIDEAGTSSSPMRYSNRRYSDFIGTTLPPIQSYRRASENPNMISPNVTTPSKLSSATAAFKQKAGIICTNTDLISLISSLASSATEINRYDDKSPAHTPTSAKQKATLTPERRSSIKTNRSNSFDVSILKNIKQQIVSTAGGGSSAGSTSGEEKLISIPTGWFTKRHQPMSSRKSSATSATISAGAATAAKPPHPTVTFAKETLDKFRDKESSSSSNNSNSSSHKDGKEGAKKSKSPLSKLKWDGRSAMVDARMIGSAIEGFLRRDSSNPSSPTTSSSGNKSSSKTRSKKSSSWFGKSDDSDSGDTCESSLCSTLKDLFVK